MSRLRCIGISLTLTYTGWAALSALGCSGQADEPTSFTRDDGDFQPGGPSGTGGSDGTGGSSDDRSGGSATGGSATGGFTTGGSATGGFATGGSPDDGTIPPVDPGDEDEEPEPDEPPTCVTQPPPAPFTETIDITWQEMTGALAGRDHARGNSLSIVNFRNFIWDQIMETGGTLNFCVRYESNVAVSPMMRDQIEASIQRGIDRWIETLEGYDCWPYDRVPTKIVGWAAMNRSTFQWADGDHPGIMYIGDDSFENAPQCAQACGRFFNRQPGYTYPNCPGGRDNHYDMSLWLTEGMGGGAGGDWGQRLGRANFTNAAGNGSVSHIFLHEVGHGFGLPDYYDPNWNAWAPPGTPKPPSVMVVGSPGTNHVSEWDQWMMRHIWTNIRNRFE